MKHYNKQIEIIRVFKHFILEWEDKDAADKQSRETSATMAWPQRYGNPTSGTEIYDDKDQLLERLRGLL